MKLKNITRGTFLSDDLKKAKSAVDQGLGLLRKSNPRSLLLKTRFGIHTYGLKKAIDVLVLDNNLKVVKQATVNSNSFFFWNIRYNNILELPMNTIKKTKTRVGDQLELQATSVVADGI